LKNVAIQIRSGDDNLGVVEHVRFVLYEASIAVCIVMTCHSLVLFTAAARRKRRLQHAAKQHAATIQRARDGEGKQQPW
jgi:hypothetical protein